MKVVGSVDQRLNCYLKSVPIFKLAKVDSSVKQIQTTQEVNTGLLIAIRGVLSHLQGTVELQSISIVL